MCILQIILLLVHGDVGDIGDIHQAERPANDSKKIRISPSLSLSLSSFDANEYSLRKSTSCSESFTHITDKTQK